MKPIVDLNYYFEETGAAAKSKTGPEIYISVPEEVFNSSLAHIAGKRRCVNRLILPAEL